MKSFIVLSLGLLATPLLAERWSADWTPVASSTDKTWVFMKRDSLRDLPPKTGRDFAVRQVWVGFDFTAVKSEKDRKSLRLYQYDCIGQRVLIVSATNYSPSGKVVSKFSEIDDYDFKYDPVVPESVGASILAAVCDS